MAVLTAQLVIVDAMAMRSVIVGLALSLAAASAATAAVPPSFVVQPATRFVLVGGTTSFNVLTSGDLPMAYQWQAGTAEWDPVSHSVVVNTWANLVDGGPYAGATTATLAVTAANYAMSSLQFRCVATNAVGSATSDTASLSLQYTVFIGAYFGALSGGGNWALWATALDRGNFIAYLPDRHSVVVQAVAIDPVTGVFTGGGTEQVAGGTGASFTVTGTVQAPLSGSGARTVTGQLAGLGQTFTGEFRAGGGGSTPLSGSYYTATALNGDKGSVYAVVGYGGDVLAVVVAPTFVDAASGGLNAAGTMAVTSAAGGQFTFAVDPNAHAITATLQPASAVKTTRFAGLSAMVAPTTRLANLSMRATAGTGDQTLIMGFVVQGGDAKRVLVRGLGPALAQYGVTGAIADPQIRLQGTNGPLVGQNDDWGGGAELAQAAVATGASPLPVNGKDSALLASLNAGSYTSLVSNAAGAAGVALCETYDADASATTRLVNVSARAPVGTGDAVLIAGFVLTGNAPKRLLIRGVGPTLAGYGVGGTLADPKLSLLQGDIRLAENDNWGADPDLRQAFTRTGAFSLPDASKDAALLVDLQPGVYTVQLSGVNGATGNALLEIYEVP